MTDIPKIFGQDVFNEDVMKKLLSKEVYDSLKKTIDEGEKLDDKIAQEVANAMKDWAISKGATHYTHWFQPMTGVTAEKHDSFISSVGNGKVIMSLSGKELIKGEPDASSLPNGGLRATFEARGYTAWDPTSYAFIKENTLCIPTAYCSYTGEALDKKTPLLRSMGVIDKQAKRILKLFGKRVKRVSSTVGAEQEYFLLDRKQALKRKDIVFTGRTLFGAKAPKGQELEDHYYGAIKPRVACFMKDLDEQLWKLGVLAKTEHNEVAPSQHELAPIFTTTNIAVDQNQLMMEIMKNVAISHDLTCVLHEKPFAGINGSGKHNNWSLATDSGVNLFNPGDTPKENAQFLLFLCAVIKAVDKHQDLLRICVATAGNDQRLGANEAPPAIISIYLGEDIEQVLYSIESGEKYTEKGNSSMDLGAFVLPKLRKDATDRNRTSPFAFTGNKFEFRMVGSSLSCAGPNTVINTIVAETLDEFATRLENAKDFNKEIHDIISDTVKNHKRILFNGNGYGDDWTVEAEKRKLLNLKTTPQALARLTDDKNVKLFTKYGVYSENELKSRQEILLENYCKTINIEALTMISMAKTQIYPAVNEYIGQLISVLNAKKSIGAVCKQDEIKARLLSDLNEKMIAETDNLEKLVSQNRFNKNVAEQAEFYCNTVLACMKKIRKYADEAESETEEKYWPFPSYALLLFGV